MGGARLAARALGWACGGALIAASAAQAAPTLVKVGEFARPTYVTAAPGDASRLFVTEQGGRVRVIRDGTTLDAPFLDLTSVVESVADERGLLSVAFAPDYATTGRFYVYLTAVAAAAASGTAGEIQVREYRRSAANPDVADPSTGRLLLAIRHDEAANHNGGQLQFGPDGKLWLGTGDGGGSDNQFGHAQDPASLLGKLIRLDPAAPTPEIMAVGLRNPWRFSFDRATGQLTIGDVGQNAYEEIDIGLAANYGWACKEGASDGPRVEPACQGAVTAPVLQKSHSGDLFCSITGGYVVRDPGLPTLLGRYLYGDFCKGDLSSFAVADPDTDTETGLHVANLVSFGEDSCGRLLVVSRDGPVSRIVDGAPSACTSTAPPAPAPAPPDTRPCSVALRATGLRSVRRLKRFSVALRVDEACSATVSARIRGVTRFRTARGSVAVGERKVLRLRLTSRGARALRSALRRHKSLPGTLRVKVVDAAGNVRTVTRGVRVRR
jgi:hypothetical protein